MKKTCVAIMILILVSSAAFADGNHDRRAMLYYLKGLFYEARRDMIHAYTYYLQANRYEPGTQVILLALSRTAFEIGKYDETRTFVGPLIASGDYAGRAKIILAELEYREGNRKKAIRILSEAKDEKGVPKFAVRKFMARIFLEMEDFKRARALLEEARKLEPDDLFVNYRLGFIYAEANETEKAVDSFRRTVDANPGFAPAHMALASILLHQGKKEEAKDSFRKTLLLEPDNRNIIKDLADLYYEDNELDAGVELLEPLYFEKKLDQPGKITLGRFYYRMERYDDALFLFKDILDSTGESPAILRVISEIELEKGNFRNGVGYLKRLIRIEPDRFSNYVGLLLVAFDLAGDAAGEDQKSGLSDTDGRLFLDEAIKHYREDSPGDNYLIGIIYRKLNKYDKARGFLLRAEELRPGDHRTLLELAALFQDYGDYEEAIKRIDYLHRKTPEDASLSNFYGYLLAEKGERLEYAEELLMDALRAEPENGYFLDSLGWIKYRRGEYHNALEIMLEAVTKVGDDPVIWEHLGDIYVKLKMFSEARGAYTNSINIDPGEDHIQDKLLEVNKAVLHVE